MEVTSKQLANKRHLNKIPVFMLAMIMELAETRVFKMHDPFDALDRVLAPAADGFCWSAWKWKKLALLLVLFVVVCRVFAGCLPKSSGSEQIEYSMSARKPRESRASSDKIAPRFALARTHQIECKIELQTPI